VPVQFGFQNCTFILLIFFNFVFEKKNKKHGQSLVPFLSSFGNHFGAHFGTRSAKEGARWAQESHQELQRAKKLHFQKPWKTFSFLVFLDPEASKRTSRGPRRLLRDTQRDTQRWSKHWSNSGQIVNPKMSKNKKTKNRLTRLTSKMSSRCPRKALYRPKKWHFQKPQKKRSVLGFWDPEASQESLKRPKKAPRRPRKSSKTLLLLLPFKAL